ncbi:hypothetical protein LG943_17650 [Streptomonospora sp. S1-112]|uniref:Uncharacterized protein n=1 Tax=Streptomonospora mangrovi TaxID=2883123 RepID=A0A9X3NNC7_9ACTN|nr:hypothetical protein [Streptomonospora mangrovi]MDA0566125.1 hypothetical protein [Streptomonospora mangrovi]
MSATEEGSVAKLIEIAHPPTPRQRLTEWASRPPGRLYIPACTLIGLILLYEESVPGGHLPSFLLGMGGGAVLAAMGALRLGIAMSIARPMILRYWLRWISAPLIALAAIVLSVTDIPLQARVEASVSALDEVRQTAEPASTMPLDEWAGMYPLSALTTTPDGVTRYTVRGAGLLDASGLAHSREELPTDVFVEGHGGVVYEHIFGDWYSWSEY